MFNSTKLFKELEAAGIPITGCNSNGEIQFAKEATDEQKALAQTILDNHNPIYYVDQRLGKDGYKPIGEEIDMLWHSINEGKFGEEAKSSSFYLNIKDVKDRFPK